MRTGSGFSRYSPPAIRTDSFSSVQAIVHLWMSSVSWSCSTSPSDGRDQNRYKYAGLKSSRLHRSTGSTVLHSHSPLFELFAIHDLPAQYHLNYSTCALRSSPSSFSPLPPLLQVPPSIPEAITSLRLLWEAMPSLETRAMPMVVAFTTQAGLSGTSPLPVSLNCKHLSMTAYSYLPSNLQTKLGRVV